MRATAPRGSAQSDVGALLEMNFSTGAVGNAGGVSDPKVEGLVYVAAFAPDKGESVSSLIKNPPPGAPSRARSNGPPACSSPCGPSA